MCLWTIPSPSPSPRVCSDSYPLSWDAIQPSHPQLPTSPPAFNFSHHQGIFQWVSSLASGGQNIAASILASVLPMNIQGWFSLGLTVLISLQFKGFSRVCVCVCLCVCVCVCVCFSQHYSVKASIIWCSVFFMVKLSHLYKTTGKSITLTIQTFVSKVLSLIFNTLPRFVTAFFPGSKHLLIFLTEVTILSDFEPKKIKSVIISIVPPSICNEMMWPDAMILVFWMLMFKPTFSLSFLSHSSRYSLLLLHFLPLESCCLHFNISEIVNISSGNFDSSLWFIQPGISHDYSSYKLNKQGDNIQPWSIPFPIWNHSFVPCPFIMAASWHACRFLRGQVTWSCIPISLRIFHNWAPHNQSP